MPVVGLLRLRIRFGQRPLLGLQGFVLRVVSLLIDVVFARRVKAAELHLGFVLEAALERLFLLADV